MPKDWASRMNGFAAKGTPFLFILNFDLSKTIVEPLQETKADEILFDVDGVRNYNPEDKKKEIKNVNIQPSPPSYREFLEKLKKVRSEISAGNTYLLNLTFKHPVKLNSSLKDIFYLSTAKYKLWFREEFVLFSPETFVKIQDGRISTFPMKGTAEKTDEDSEKKLIEDPKESAEHATITDLLRNDLGRVADNIRVKKYRYVDEVNTGKGTILQVSSEICGELSGAYRESPGDLFAEILPAGSVTGAPKKKTVDIIRAVENYDRDFYTGVFGIFDGRNIDSAVMIRFLEREQDKFFYKSGGGITFMSDPDKEYRELLQKIYVPIH